MAERMLIGLSLLLIIKQLSPGTSGGGGGDVEIFTAGYGAGF